MIGGLRVKLDARYLRATAVMLALLSAGPASRLLAGALAYAPPQQLSVSGMLRDIRTLDLSGDGRGDIVALHEVRGDVGVKWALSVFEQKKGGTFPGAADRTIEVDTTIALISAGTMAGTGEGILALLAPDGIRLLDALEGSMPGKTRKWIPIETPVRSPSMEGPIFCDLIRDWDGDGREDMLVFDFTGFSLLSLENGDLPEERGHIHSPPVLEAQPGNRDPLPHGEGARLILRYGFPAVTVGEYDGDGKVDLYITNGGRIQVARREGSSYARPIRVKEFSRADQRRDGEGPRLEVRLGDFSGDGLTDIVEAWWEGSGLSGTQAEFRLYRGIRGGGYPRDPDQVLRVTDAVPRILLLEDLNSDGRSELIVPTMKFGIMAFVRILTTGNIEVEVQVFDTGSRGLFEEKPRFVHWLSARVDFSGTTRIVSELEDLDDDGNLDLIFGTRKDEIAVFRGTGGKGNRIFSREPDLLIQEDASGFLRTGDLNGDGKRDIVLYYPTGGVIKVYLSAG